MISICIPTRNAGTSFRRTLALWREQEADEEIELVVVDSGSTDNTVEQCRAAGAVVRQIAPDLFNHGETRNQLARQARGDVLVFTVQDAWPANGAVLRELVQPLRDDAGLAGVCGRQFPHPDADFLGRWETTQLAKILGTQPRRKQMASWTEFLSLDLGRRFASVSFDNVCSAVRRTTWEAMPFAPIDFGEDLEWAVRVLRGGGTVLFNPLAGVFHSHCRPPLAWLRRYFLGRRRTNHILHMPAEYAELEDETALHAIQRFHAQVANFIDKRWNQQVMSGLARAVILLLPEALQRPLRRLGLLGKHYFINWQSGTRPVLTLGHLWLQVMKSNGEVPSSQVGLVARQLEAVILGEFLGSYYHTCEVQQRLSPRLISLGQWLAGPGSDGNGSGEELGGGLEPFFSLLGRAAPTMPAGAPAIARDSGQ